MCMCFGWMHIRNPWKKRYEKVLKMFVFLKIFGRL